MAISYDKFTEAFLRKVTEYDFIRLDPFERNAIVDGYMKAACAQFNRVCPYDLVTRDDNVRELSCDIPDDEIDEIVEIVSEGMLVQWFKPYLMRADALQNVLNTTDFSAYSPAELLYRMTNAYNAAEAKFQQDMRDYSYYHGDLTVLHT